MKTPVKNIPFVLGKYQAKNLKGEAAKVNGKYFLRPVVFSTLDTEDVAEAMRNRGCAYKVGDIAAVLDYFFDVAFELITQNRRVKMKGLGTLGITVSSDPADTEGECSVAQVKGAHIRLLPDSSQDQQLDSVSLKDRMQFSFGLTTSAEFFVDNDEQP